MGVYITKSYKNYKTGKAVVTGDAATTDIPIAGIKTTDELYSVIEHDATSALPTDHTAEASITSDGNIQLSTTDTSTDTLIVEWASSDMG